MDVEKSARTSRDSEELSFASSNITPVKKSSRGFFGDFIDGFKRADLSDIDVSKMTELEIQEHLVTRAPLRRDLNALQISLIAIGGSIGSGLFVGSGNSFQTGGPGGVIIGFSVVAVMIFCTMHALGELACKYPVNGGFLAFVTRFIDPSWSLAMGWNYAIYWLVSFPLELISTAITLAYWDHDNNGATNVNKSAWVALFYVVCIGLNLFGAKGYGWGEAVLSIIKVIAVLGFCIFGIITTCGGYSGTYGPTDQPGYLHGLTGKYIGGHFWQNPGSFVAGAKGVFSVLINAAFSFAGAELSGLAAAETKNPQKAIPRAVKQTFWRIVLFYLVSLSIVGCLIPYTDARLGTYNDGRASPFVLSIKNANVKALPSIFNVVICLSVLSVGNSGVYAASRTIASLAAQGLAPRFFAYIDRRGRPLVGIGIVALLGLLCFLSATPRYKEVFNWLQAICGLSGIFTWGSINLAHIRFRIALRAHGRSTDELVFKAAAGIWGSVLGFSINVVIVCLQFWIALYPVGENPSASGFFSHYLSFPVVIILYLVAKTYLGQWSKFYIKTSEMDLDAGARSVDLDVLREEIAAEERRIRSRGILYRTYKFWC